MLIDNMRRWLLLLPEVYGNAPWLSVWTSLFPLDYLVTLNCLLLCCAVSRLLFIQKRDIAVFHTLVVGV